MTNELKTIQKLLYDAQKNTELAQGCHSPQKASEYLDAALQKAENACISARRLAERIRPTTPHTSAEHPVNYQSVGKPVYSSRYPSYRKTVSRQRYQSIRDCSDAESLRQRGTFV